MPEEKLKELVKKDPAYFGVRIEEGNSMRVYSETWPFDNSFGIVVDEYREETNEEYAARIAFFGQMAKEKQASVEVQEKKELDRLIKKYGVPK